MNHMPTVIFVSLAFTMAPRIARAQTQKLTSDGAPTHVDASVRNEAPSAQAPNADDTLPTLPDLDPSTPDEPPRPQEPNADHAPSPPSTSMTVPLQAPKSPKGVFQLTGSRGYRKLRILDLETWGAAAGVQLYPKSVLVIVSEIGFEQGQTATGLSASTIHGNGGVGISLWRLRLGLGPQLGYTWVHRKSDGNHLGKVGTGGFAFGAFDVVKFDAVSLFVGGRVEGMAFWHSWSPREGTWAYSATLGLSYDL